MTTTRLTIYKDFTEMRGAWDIVSICMKYLPLHFKEPINNSFRILQRKNLAKTYFMVL
jgi:hypothetical protein